MSDKNTMWTCFRYFLYYLQPSLFAAKGINAKSTYIESAKSSYTEGTYISNTCTKGTYAGNIFSTIDLCIKGAGLDATDTEDIVRESAYTKSACAVKYSRIHLQFFSILKIELFDIG